MEKNAFPTEINAKRVALKKHDLSLAPLMFSYVEKDRERLRQFLPWVDSTKTVQDEIDYIKMTLEAWETFQLIDYGIFRQSDNQYLGNIGVVNISFPHQRCELGYWILGEFEGQGYMSESVQALEEICFEKGFNRIEIRCSSKNKRSSRVPELCGYQLEAQLREQMFEMGSFRDTLVYGKLKRDFLKKEKPQLPADLSEKLDLAIRLRTEDQGEKALEVLKELLQIAPNDPTINYQMAWTNDFMGYESAAAPYYEAAIANGLSGEDRQGAMLGLGSTYRCLGEYEKSLKVFDQAVQEFPENHSLKTFRALTLFNLGRTEESVGSLLIQLLDTTNDPSIKIYGNALRFYSDKLHQTWK